MGRKGISLVALVITIIVLVVLTGAVVITGVNVPQQGQLAVFKNNISNVQDAVTLKMLNNMADKISSNNENVKWIGVISGYTDTTQVPIFDKNINGVQVAQLDSSLKESVNISESEFSKYYIDRNGIIYHEGKNIDGVIYYNKNMQSSINLKDLSMYGIKREIESTSTAWTRIEDSTNLEANATLYGTLNGRNDFDSLYPWSAIRSYNYNPITDTITAWHGESGYKADGSNGDVLTYVPEFWYKRIQPGDGYEYIYISAIDPNDNTFTKSEAFSIARYETYIENNKTYSRAGVIPTTNINISDFRDTTTGTSDKYCLMDYRYFVLQLLYLVEYADYDSQKMLGDGFTRMNWYNSDVALLSETAVNRIIVNDSIANDYIIGQQISIGTNLGSIDVVYNRTITKKEDYSIGDINGTAIYFDGVPTNITSGNSLYHSAQKTGSTDSLGMKSGTPGVADTTGMIYRGVENAFGNVWKWIDGLNIKDNELFVCYNPTSYNSTTFTSPYELVGTIPSTEEYIQTLGYNENHSLIAYPLTLGTKKGYIPDQYFTNNVANGPFFVGGSYNRYGSAGWWCWFKAYDALGASPDIGMRILKYK